VSPDGSKVAFNHQPDPLINSFSKSNISIVDLSSKKISALVTNPSSDGLETWSPDSKQVLYSTNLTDTTSNFYMNSKLLTINVADKSVKQLAKDLDEDLGGGYNWEPSGIYFHCGTRQTVLFIKSIHRREASRCS